ncbi:MAG TPA: WD40 repeat domain-containing protein [Candidatus Babeliales bacterium]|nr:WD40 repeat domain-containing protein [Candidatus Babeliales bacterium]
MIIPRSKILLFALCIFFSSGLHPAAGQEEQKEVIAPAEEEFIKLTGGLRTLPPPIFQMIKGFVAYQPKDLFDPLATTVCPTMVWDNAQDPARLIAWSKNGKHIATKHIAKIRIYNTANKTARDIKHTKHIRLLAVNSDGSSIVVALKKINVIHVIDGITGIIKRKLRQNKRDRIGVITFDHADHIISTGGNMNVHMWNTNNQIAHSQLMNHQYPICLLSTSSDGHTMVTAAITDSYAKTPTCEMGLDSDPTTIACSNTSIAIGYDESAGGLCNRRMADNARHEHYIKACLSDNLANYHRNQRIGSFPGILHSLAINDTGGYAVADAYQVTVGNARDGISNKRVFNFMRYGTPQVNESGTRILTKKNKGACLRLWRPMHEQH